MNYTQDNQRIRQKINRESLVWSFRKSQVALELTNCSGRLDPTPVKWRNSSPKVDAGWEKEWDVVTPGIPDDSSTGVGIGVSGTGCEGTGGSDGTISSLWVRF